MEKWHKLPLAQQQQVIHFVELLETQTLERVGADSPDIPTIEIWSPYDSYTAAQDLLQLLATDPGEDCA